MQMARMLAHVTTAAMMVSSHETKVASVAERPRCKKTIWATMAGVTLKRLSISQVEAKEEEEDVQDATTKDGNDKDLFGP